MKAIILAAGKSVRLGNLTSDKPKGMLDFMGKSLLEHQILMYRSVNINDIIIIRGYKKEKITYKDVQYVDNDLFDDTNMVESLICARKHMDDNCIISYSDILFSKKLLSSLIKDTNSIAITVDSNWKKYWLQRYGSITTDIEDLQIEKNKITRIGQKTNNSQLLDYRYVGLNKFSLNGLKKMLTVYDDKKIIQEKWKSSGNSFKNGYMTDLLQEMIDKNIDINPHITENEWLEIDTSNDYNVAKYLFLKKQFEF